MTQSEYFNRQIQLWGETTQKSLQNKKIAIIGAGGLGSTLAQALGTSGIGEIHMVDFDTVSSHNIHRQIAFTLEDEGQSKSKAVCKLIESKNPFVKAVAFDMAFDNFKEYIVSQSGIDGKRLSQPLRILMTGAQNGPELGDIYPLIRPYITEIARNAT